VKHRLQLQPNLQASFLQAAQRQALLQTPQCHSMLQPAQRQAFLQAAQRQTRLQTPQRHSMLQSA
jgi:hypothetical protein